MILALLMRESLHGEILKNKRQTFVFLPCEMIKWVLYPRIIVIIVNSHYLFNSLSKINKVCHAVSYLGARQHTKKNKWNFVTKL